MVFGRFESTYPISFLYYSVFFPSKIYDMISFHGDNSLYSYFNFSCPFLNLKNCLSLVSQEQTFLG